MAKVAAIALLIVVGYDVNSDPIEPMLFSSQEALDQWKEEVGIAEDATDDEGSFTDEEGTQYLVYTAGNTDDCELQIDAALSEEEEELADAA